MKLFSLFFKGVIFRAFLILIVFFIGMMLTNSQALAQDDLSAQVKKWIGETPDLKNPILKKHFKELNPELYNEFFKRTKGPEKELISPVTEENGFIVFNFLILQGGNAFSSEFYVDPQTNKLYVCWQESVHVAGKFEGYHLSPTTRLPLDDVICSTEKLRLLLNSNR